MQNEVFYNIKFFFLMCRKNKKKTSKKILKTNLLSNFMTKL